MGYRPILDAAKSLVNDIKNGVDNSGCGSSNGGGCPCKDNENSSNMNSNGKRGQGGCCKDLDLWEKTEDKLTVDFPLPKYTFDSTTEPIFPPALLVAMKKHSEVQQITDSSMLLSKNGF